MSATHADRRAVYESLEPLIGQDAANRLMDLLPHFPELVTRDDMFSNTLALRGDLAELRGELKGEMAELRAELRGEMAELRTDLTGQMAELRTDLTGQMAELRTELRGEMSERFERNQRWLVGAVATNLLAILAATLAVVLALV